MATESWKLEKDLCRCCHAKGSFQNLEEPCISLGQREVYSEMLKTCLHIELTPVPGLLSAMTYTICEACVLRLRDADNFRKQVILCEERFKDMYKNIMIGANSESDVKPVVEVPVIKEELPPSDEDVPFSSWFDNESEDDDKPVLQVKLEDEKKAKSKPRPKPKPKTKVKKSPVKKATKKKQAAETVEKAEEMVPGKATPQQGRRDRFTVSEAGEGSKTFTCNTCKSPFKTLDDFTQHYDRVHLKSFHHRSKWWYCYMCSVEVPSHLRSAHLEEVHGKSTPSSNSRNKKYAIPKQVLTVKRERKFECKECLKKYVSLNSLRTHSVTHLNLILYKCTMCEKGFKMKKNLSSHMRIHLNDRRA